MNKVIELTNGPQVILIRHGKSIANEEHDKLSELPREERFGKWNLNKSLRDARLSKLGIDQATQASATAESLKVHTVFVSPLRRTLETTYYMFKNHPNFSKINFIILPTLRESLNTVSDIPENIDSIKEEYQKLIPHLDFSLFKSYNSKYYYIEDMPKKIQEKISELIPGDISKSYIDP